jgi:aminomuconate-semialdehyde/2-hydroxymuconate-6-semialdehyde dehydrogenase
MTGSQPTDRILNFIDGRYTEGSSGTIFENVYPADGSRIGVVHEAGAGDVDAAVQAARKALKGPWSTMSPEQRAQVLYRVADGIGSRFDEFVAAEVRDTGKPISLASHLDIPRGSANFKIFADLVRAHGQEFFQMA